MVTEVMDAGENRQDSIATGARTRIGMFAGVMRRILNYGLYTAKMSEVRSCATVMNSFLYQCGDVTVRRTGPQDIIISLARVTADLVHCKGRKYRRPLELYYVINPAWAPGTGPHVLLQRWLIPRSASARLFNLRAGKLLGAASLGTAVAQAPTLISAVPPAAFYYAPHSARIGGLNELVNLHYSKPWIAHRLDQRSLAMFSVHFDSRVLLTADSGCFFGQLRRAVTAH